MELIVRSEIWEAPDEFVVTVNGKPCGPTLSKDAAAEVARWLTGARRELSEILLKSQLG